jgi:hypothetical protein
MLHLKLLEKEQAKPKPAKDRNNKNKTIINAIETKKNHTNNQGNKKLAL